MIKRNVPGKECNRTKGVKGGLNKFLGSVSKRSEEIVVGIGTSGVSVEVIMRVHPFSPWGSP